MSILDGLFAPANRTVSEVGGYGTASCTASEAGAMKLPDSLADEAMAVVGFHDAMRAQNLEELRKFRERLAANIERETEALAEVDAMIAREEPAKPSQPPVSKRKGREAMA